MVATQQSFWLGPQKARKSCLPLHELQPSGGSDGGISERWRAHISRRRTAARLCSGVLGRRRKSCVLHCYGGRARLRAPHAGWCGGRCCLPTDEISPVSPYHLAETTTCCF